jgi:hypothetical protein
MSAPKKKTHSKAKAVAMTDGHVHAPVQLRGRAAMQPTFTSGTMQKMEATLTFVLSIDNHSGNGVEYYLRSYDQKCDVKNELLTPLRTPNVANLLASWKSLLIDVDPVCCELSLAQLQQEIGSRLTAAGASLADPVDGVGFEVGLGQTFGSSLCAKVPDCGHICYHMFAATDASTGTPWIRVFDGVQAQVLVCLEWQTMAMSDTHIQSLAAAVRGQPILARARGAGGTR